VVLLQVEFAPPVGYKEPVKHKKEDEEMAVDPADLMPEPVGFVAFRGAGNRLDGKRGKIQHLVMCFPANLSMLGGSQIMIIKLGLSDLFEDLLSQIRKMNPVVSLGRSVGLVSA
jgi:hypothetical protein